MAGPLSGLKVLDFTRLLPGPFGTMVLADMGADVVRVEAPNVPDLMHFMPPMDGDVGVPHRQINRSKRSIRIDLKKPEGAEVVKRLVKDYDVMIEQFRPGVLDRLGCGYKCVSAENPALIYCSITGYGQTGPYRDRAGHDINYLSIGGVASFSGRKDTGPVLSGIQIADQCAGGLNAVVAILAALFSREKTGKGQEIDISMTDGAVHLGAIYAAALFKGGEEPKAGEMVLNGGGFYDFYETRDGQHMSVGSLEPQFFNKMIETIGRKDLLGKGGLDSSGGGDLKQGIRDAFKQKTRAEWEEIFAKTDCCVEPVLSMSEMAEHPQVLAREMVVEVEKAGGQKLKQIGSPYKFSDTPCEYKFAGVSPGTHTAEILKESGFTEDEIEGLKSKNVVK